MTSDAELTGAFAADGLQVERVERLGGARGILASSTADRSRKVLYLEGSPRAQGYLTGLLAGEAVERMAGEFVDNVVGAFVSGGRARPLRLRRLKRQLLDILRDRCLRTYYRRPGDVPVGLREEMKGMAAGCRARDPHTAVSYRELFLLNTGIDLLLSYVYSGAHRMDWIPDVRRLARLLRGRPRLERWVALAASPRRPSPRRLRMPLGCNAFSIARSLTEGRRRYLGRDFMFPTAGVFQDTCCLVVRVPEGGRIPTVSVSAPGMVGCVTSINSRGIGLGVDMVAGGRCDFHHPGLNSLLLLREAAESAASLDQAIARILAAPRGVSWLYVIADGDGDAAAVVEAGARARGSFDPASIPQPYRDLVASLSVAPAPEGAAVRPAGYRLRSGCLDLNGRLFGTARLPHPAEAEGPGGRFHASGPRPWKQHAVPGPFYFPPARMERDDLLVAGNQYLTPEMRVSSMGAWVSLVAGGHEDDAQWRSDELSARLMETAQAAAARGRGISLEEAKAILDFLSPLGQWPAYYARNATTPRGKRIEGALALCDLTARVMHASFGAYDGIWVRLSLPAYLPES
jgi:hypothetical protein